MGLINWLRSLFKRPRPTFRDISTVPEQRNSAEVVQELISVEPQPLKPSHRRLTFRDQRLLPKVKPNRPHVWNASRKKPVMTADEANRLFSRTMLTRNRYIRDLLADEEQLQRYKLPIWRDEADLAGALDLTIGELRHFSMHRDRETTPHYVAFAVPKRGGGLRIIHAPKRRLKAVQRRLNELLIRHLTVSEQAHGFRPGRSVLSNALPHVNRAVVVKMDLQDCFPTIHFGRVRGLLIALGYGYQVATALAVLMTEAPRQPVEVENNKIFHVPVGPRVCVQGAPTSPGLCNAILLRLDRRLAGLASNHGFGYTRYADDLTFSGDDADKIKLLLNIVPRIVGDEGFAVNANKTRVQRRGQRQRVTGVVVNQQAGLSRRERRRLRARIHQFDGNDEERQRLAGKLAYLKMLNPEQAAPLLKAFYGH